MKQVTIYTDGACSGNPGPVGIDGDVLHSSIFRTAMNASEGTDTVPNVRMRFLPSFCFSSSLRLRLMSPP